MSGPAGRKKKFEGQGSFTVGRKCGPATCAECKRLKIKCTKSVEESFPCISCIRRGCQAICPEGSLAAGKGGRFVLANTEELHKKILELSNRVRVLEDALQELQATRSTEPHPLLRKDLLLLKAPNKAELAAEDGPSDLEQLKTLDSLGSLSLRTSGRSNFHAQTAGSWYFLQNEDPNESDTSQDEEGNVEFTLPAEICYASHTFPLGTLGNMQKHVQIRLQEFVPDRDTALRLVENYFHGMAWMYDPVPRRLFDETIFSPVYTYVPIGQSCESTILAVFFTVLAIGTLLDLNFANDSPQAAQYYQLARAALSVDLALDEPPLATIQALHLMGFFLHMSDFKGGFGTSWAMMGLNAKLAIGVGLHRDCTKWNLGHEDEVRRQLFWELFTYDTWQSMPSGRPPSFHRLSVDCKMPYENLLAQGAKIDDPCLVFKAWKHRFCYEKISPMVEQAFGPRTPAYATILFLDRRIREDPIPPLLQITPTVPTPTQPTDHDRRILSMQRYAVLCVREISLLLMHRPFFAQATTEKAPLESKFAPSILAIYRSSCCIIAGVRDLYHQEPKLLPRAWTFWAHAFSATVCLGGLVIRCPSLSLAPSALTQVESTCELFHKVTDSNRTSKALPSMLKLRDKARQVLADYRSGQHTLSTEQQQQEELSALVGETRLVVHRTQQSGSPERSTWWSANSLVQVPASTASIDYQQFLQEQTQANAGHPSNPDSGSEAADSYRTPYPVHGYASFGQQPEQSLVDSVMPATQAEYHYPLEYLPQHMEQAYGDQPDGAWDNAWQNFVSQLGMDRLM